MSKTTHKKAGICDILLLAHNEGVFIVTHPRSSDVLILDKTSFVKMFQIPEDKKAEFFAEIEKAVIENRRYDSDWNDFSIIYTKAIDIVGVYTTFKTPKIFLNGEI